MTVDPAIQERVLAGEFGPIHGTFRYLRCDSDGVPKEDMTKAIAGGSIVLNNERVTLRTASFDINGEFFPDGWDYDDDFVQCYADISMLGEVVSYPLGLFQLSYPTQSLVRGNWFGQALASDLTDRFARYKPSDSTVISSASSYTSAIRSLLNSAGLRHNITGSVDATSTVLVWPPGTTRRDLAADLADGFNRYPVWPDETGVFQLTPRIVNSMIPGIDVHGRYIVNLGTFFSCTYNMNGAPSMVVGQPRLSRNTAVLANKVRAVFTDPNAYAGTAGGGYYLVTNDDGDSPISVSKTEERYFPDPGVDRVSTSNLLNWALYQAANQDTLSVLMSMQTLWDPRRTAHEYYRVIGNDPIPTPDGVWKVLSWTLPLNFNQPMVHNLALTRTLHLTFQAVL